MYLAAVDILHYEAEELRGLEGVLERGQERMRALGKHIVFRQCVRKLVLLQNRLFLQNLTCTNTAKVTDSHAQSGAAKHSL